MKFQDLTSIPIIDAHVHVFPPQLFKALKNWFKEHAWEFLKDGTAEEFIREQFDGGAAGLVLMPYAHRPGIARELNEFMADLLESYPHTVGLAAIHPEDEKPARIIRHAFEQCGLCGVKMHCHVKGVAPDDPAMFPIYEAVAERDGIVTVHAGREPAIEAYGLDVRAITGAERLGKVLRNFPDLKIVIPHLGIDETDRFYDLMDEYPHLYMDTAMVLSPFFMIEIDIERLIGHADRILYGTDYPQIPHPAETELKKLLSLGLDEKILRKLLFENAKKLFPITPKTGI
jgi:predicted TIM-barrel fold metal-dependent hydrolase